MEVLIDNKQSKRPISEEKIKKTAQVILSALDCPEGELSILIVDDPQIAVYNQAYLDRSGPTNVIAFPMREGAFSDISPHLLGDVMISVETAQREGETNNQSMEDRFDELLIHGILHLFGYDHEKNDRQATAMETKSRELTDLIRA